MKNRFADRGKSHAGYFLRFVFCLVLTAAASLAQAQNRNQVSGKVTDKAGEPLIGATVVVVGTTTGATTGGRRSFHDRGSCRRRTENLLHRLCGADRQGQRAVGARHRSGGRQPDAERCRRDRLRHDGEEVGDFVHLLDQGRRSGGRHGRLDHRHGASGQDSRPDHFGQRQPQQQQRLPAARRGFGQRQQRSARDHRRHPRRRHARAQSGGHRVGRRAQRRLGRRHLRHARPPAV